MLRHTPLKVVVYKGIKDQVNILPPPPPGVLSAWGGGGRRMLTWPNYNLNKQYLIFINQKLDYLTKKIWKEVK